MKKNMLRNFVVLFALAVLSVTLYSCSGRSDEEIRKDITEKLAANPDMAGVNAAVVDKIATLSGQVKDEQIREKTESVVTGVKGVKQVVNDISIAPRIPDNPVEVAPDDAISRGVTDAVKDFPGVNASVNNGEVTLTGTITRDRLVTLMQSISTLKPKKINNQLTIK
ncbi:BON domain-containing protein [Segetibacter sp. 3557_3]|uniref:BON domain-containing protein n=1 Tax=Segetibacter sp. 3557_3 TaxID=2547429 RepID=UPI001058EDE4|nr:BON domain-containing protein [Segetibacter sp. 3557_3]TDH27379.1 BON domain-containing protein [Segetibacter sp. 3557_3]